MTKTSPRHAPRAALAWSAVIAFSVLVSPARASHITSTDDFADVFNVVMEYAEKVGPERVLLVLDIDNTLLAMQQPLGSDQWFEWQKYLIDHEPWSQHAVADSFDGLLEAQGLLYNLGRMRPPQKNLPLLLNRLQRKGIRTIVLTSRGDEFREATERELQRNGYDFWGSALTVRDAPTGVYMPYDLDNLEASGLTRQEAKAFGLEEPKPISYVNGIAMTAGQHKGAMLLTLLNRSDEDIQAVVLDDDNIRNVGQVFGAVAGRDKEITAVHYTREEPTMKRFQYGDKSEVTRRWRELNSVLDEVFEADVVESGEAKSKATPESNGAPQRMKKKLRTRMPAGASR